MGGERGEPGPASSLLLRSHPSRDSGAEVSEDELEEVGLCEGGRLVELMMTTLRNTCSLLLLSPNTDIKNGEMTPPSLPPSLPLNI